MTFGLQPYPAYKPSGVEWLGDIPAHWEVRRLRYVADMRVSNVDKHVKDDEISARLCNYVDVYKNDYINGRMDFMRATATHEEIERFRLEKDDVLITKDSEAWNDIGVPALVTESAADLISGYHLALLRPRLDTLAGAYLLRALQSKGLAYQFHVEAKGVTRYGLSHAGIKSVWLPLPPLSEQTAIVRFLDHADRRIRRYIRAKQKLIALLEEQKQAIIHQAVTGQIDVRTGQPYPAYKPSGIEWLGDVPVHWEIPRIKQCVRTISKGTTPSTEGRETSEYGQVRFLKAENITSGEISDKPLLYIDEDTNNLLRRSQLQEGDVLFVIAGATLGKTALVREELLPANTNQAVAFIRPHKQLDSIYLAYWLQSPRVKELTWLNAVQSAQPNLSMTNLGNFLIPFSPFPEQAAIVSYLDKATAAVDIVIRRTRYQIDHLSEYRTRLIADVVTGKFDVREAAAALPEADPLAAEDDLDEAFAAGNESEFDNEEELAEAAD